MGLGFIKTNQDGIPEVGYFKKVSLEQFMKDVMDNDDLKQGIFQHLVNNRRAILFDADLIKQYITEEIYPNIELPKRATKGSAGYDFKFPYPDYILPYGHAVKIPSGIKCYINDGWVLTEHIRSSLGFKHQLCMANTVGIIDSDYFDCEANEGHIFIKLVNNNLEKKSVIIGTGDGYCQGIFLPFGITINDDTEETRIGGMGSTNNK